MSINSEQSIKYAKALAQVRETGEANMFDRVAVFGELNNLGLYSEAVNIVQLPMELYLHYLSLSAEY